MKPLHFIISALLPLCQGACTPGHNDVCEFHTLSRDGWVYGDTLAFVASLGDSTATASPVIALRHNNAYLYSNLWLEVSRPGHHGARVRDSVNLKLADIYGRWQGMGFGASYQLTSPLPPLPAVADGDTVTVRHIMRVDTLRDIEQIGIIFVPTSE